jgi:hypothetical protein
LLREAGCPVPEKEIVACTEGASWVGEHLPGDTARVQELEVEETGKLARAVAYG